MSDPIDLFRGLPMLRGLPPHDVVGIDGERVELDAGERLFSQGEPASFVYGVVTGRVQITKQSPGGRELALEVLGPGEIIAVVAVLRGIPLPATATAMEPAACVRVPAAPFLKLVEKHPQVATRLLDVVARRLVDSGASRLALATEPVEVRIAQALLHLAERYGSKQGQALIFSQGFSRQNLADLAGTTVETTIRVMSRWTRDGLVRSATQRISILDPEELKRIAGASSSS